MILSKIGRRLRVEDIVFSPGGNPRFQWNEPANLPMFFPTLGRGGILIPFFIGLNGIRSALARARVYVRRNQEETGTKNPVSRWGHSVRQEDGGCLLGWYAVSTVVPRVQDGLNRNNFRVLYLERIL